MSIWYSVTFLHRSSFFGRWHPGSLGWFISFSLCVGRADAVRAQPCLLGPSSGSPAAWVNGSQTPVTVCFLPRGLFAWCLSLALGMCLARELSNEGPEYQLVNIPAFCPLGGTLFEYVLQSLTGSLAGLSPSGSQRWPARYHALHWFPFLPYLASHTLTQIDHCTQILFLGSCLEETYPRRGTL